MQRVMPDRLLQSMMTADRHGHVHDAVIADDHAGLHFNYALERDLNTMMHVLPFLPPIFLYMILIYMFVFTSTSCTCLHRSPLTRAHTPTGPYL